MFKETEPRTLRAISPIYTKRTRRSNQERAIGHIATAQWIAVGTSQWAPEIWNEHKKKRKRTVKENKIQKSHIHTYIHIYTHIHTGELKYNPGDVNDKMKFSFQHQLYTNSCHSKLKLSQISWGIYAQRRIIFPSIGGVGITPEKWLVLLGNRNIFYIFSTIKNISNRWPGRRSHRGSRSILKFSMI